VFSLRLEKHSEAYNIRKNKPLNKFHASENAREVRNCVYEIIQKLDPRHNIVFSIIMEKKKSHSRNATNFHKHQQNATKYLLGGILHSLDFAPDDKLIICFDSMPCTNKNDKDSMIK